MFTGLIEDVGRVVSMRRSSSGARLSIRTSLDGLDPGESIAVNGACQTVTAFRAGEFSCDVLRETLRVTNLGDLASGDPVNLERALRAGGRMGGHIVNGHVDGTGTLRRVSASRGSIEISVPPELAVFLVPKGSVAVDGISLTVGPEVGRDSFTVYVIPHTLENTTLHRARAGVKVNIETDILAKYIHKFKGS